MKKFWLHIVCLLVFCGTNAHANLLPLNLNDFYVDPTVTISPDGSSALLQEDPIATTVYLSNNPLCGDPGIKTPAGLLSMTFTYSFERADGNDDEFYARIYNGLNSDTIKVFSVNETSNNTITWDLSGLSSDVKSLGLDFYLMAWDMNADSYATVKDVSFTTKDVSPVPIPAAIYMLFSGLLGMVSFCRKKRS